MPPLPQSLPTIITASHRVIRAVYGGRAAWIAAHPAPGKPSRRQPACAGVSRRRPGPRTDDPQSCERWRAAVGFVGELRFQLHGTAVARCRKRALDSRRAWVRLKGIPPERWTFGAHGDLFDPPRAGVFPDVPGIRGRNGRQLSPECADLRYSKVKESHKVGAGNASLLDRACRDRRGR